MYSQEFLDELNSRSPLEEIAASYVNLRRRGKTLLGLCPFHSEKTPSFTIYPESNSFYCFGCNKGGGVIQFIMGVENLSFTDAVAWLAQRAGMRVPEDGGDNGLSRLRTRILEINRESGRFFYKALSSSEGKAGLEYFKKRGLDAKTIKKFGLGYSPESGFALTNHLRSLGYTPSELQASDMVRLSKKGNLYDRYRGRVMFPIFDLRGNVVAFGGRILTDEKPKYINTSDTPVYHKSSGLFAMNIAKDAGTKTLILAEGYMDVIALHRAGFTNAIASLGTSLTGEQVRVISRYANEVVICYDSDEAGRRASDRAIPMLKEAGLMVKIVTVPGGKDPDEFMRINGRDGPAMFRWILEESPVDTEYKLEKIRQKYDLSSTEGKQRYVSEATSTVLKGLKGLEYDLYAQKLSQETGAGIETIASLSKSAAGADERRKARELSRAQMHIAGTNSKVNPERKNHLKAAQAEDKIITYLFNNQDKAGELLQIVSPEMFITSFNRRVYKKLLDKIIEGSTELSPGMLDEGLTPDEVSEIMGAYARNNGVAATMADVAVWRTALAEERERLTPEEMKTASPQELNDIVEKIRETKLHKEKGK